MAEPRIPQILESLDGPSWSLASQLAKYQKKVTGASQYLDAFKSGVSPEDIFHSEADQIIQEDMLAEAEAIAKRSVEAGVSDDDFAKQIQGGTPSLDENAQGRAPSQSSNARNTSPDVNQGMRDGSDDGFDATKFETSDEAAMGAAQHLKTLSQRLADEQTQYEAAVKAYGDQAKKETPRPGRADIQRPDTVEAIVTLAAMLLNPGKFSGSIAKAMLDSKTEDQDIRTKQALQDWMIADEQSQRALTALKDVADRGFKAMQEAQDAKDKAVDKADKTAVDLRNFNADEKHRKATLAQGQERIGQAGQRLNIKVEDSLVKGYEDRLKREVDPEKFTKEELKKRVEELNDYRAELHAQGVPLSRLPRPLGVDDPSQTKGGLNIAKSEQDLTKKINENVLFEMTVPDQIAIIHNKRLDGDDKVQSNARRKVLDNIEIASKTQELAWLPFMLKEKYEAMVGARKKAEQSLADAKKAALGQKPISGSQVAQTQAAISRNRVEAGKIQAIVDNWVDDPEKDAPQNAGRKAQLAGIAKMYLEEADRQDAELKELIKSTVPKAGSGLSTKAAETRDAIKKAFGARVDDSVQDRNVRGGVTKSDHDGNALDIYPGKHAEAIRATLMKRPGVKYILYDGFYWQPGMTRWDNENKHRVKPGLHGDHFHVSFVRDKP